MLAVVFFVDFLSKRLIVFLIFLISFERRLRNSIQISLSRLCDAAAAFVLVLL